MEKNVDARNNLIDMNLIQPLKTDFFINLPLFWKYPAISINSYFYKMNLLLWNDYCLIYAILNQTLLPICPQFTKEASREGVQLMTKKTTPFEMYLKIV